MQILKGYYFLFGFIIFFNLVIINDVKANNAIIFYKEKEIFNIIKNHDLSQIDVLKKSFRNLEDSNLYRVSALKNKIYDNRKDFYEKYDYEISRVIFNKVKVQEELFVKNKFTKSLYAALIVRLDTDGDKYWNYLSNVVSNILQSDMPIPLNYDTNNRLKRGEYNPDFLKWCEENNVDKELAAGFWFYYNPYFFRFLGLSKDSRAFKLLSQGISSNNELIVRSSVDGLALLGDKRGISLIKKVCDKYKDTPIINFVSYQLFYFDDPEAHRLAKECLSKNDGYKKNSKKIDIARKKYYPLLLGPLFFLYDN